jgi:hypothetical protein
MPAFKDAPIKYEKPYMGQVYKRIQDEGRIEYGVVNGIRDQGSPQRWIAHLTSGFQEFREVIGSEKAYANTADWHPVPEAEQPLVRRILELEAAVAQLLTRIQRLEDTPASERPRRPAPA